jgi:transposase InsO family protein
MSYESKSCFWSRCFNMQDESKDDWAKLITAASNQNLTAAKKELLVWHHRLSHASLAQIHTLCRQKRRLKVESTDDLVPYRDGPCLLCKHKMPDNVCEGLLCAACAISKAKRRAPSVRTTTGATKEMTLKEDDLQPGDCISCDHYISPVVGRVTADSGYSSSRHGYTCGTIYVDHASGFIFVQHQKSTSAEDTIRGKLLVEREARDVGVKIKKYHSDNGVFASKEFKDHCTSLEQDLTFSGVGAKFQNGVAERGIGTVSNMARANMIHATLHYGLDAISSTCGCLRCFTPFGCTIDCRS